MLNFLLENAGADTSGGFNPWTIIIIVVLIAAFYFLMIRPQKKQEKKDAEMRDALAVGDEVTTIGGIIGKVVSIKGETFVLETTKDKTKIRFLRGAIRSVDVKAADIAAAVVEGNQAEAAPAEVENATDAVAEIAEAPAETEAAAEAAPEAEESTEA